MSKKFWKLAALYLSTFAAVQVLFPSAVFAQENNVWVGLCVDSDFQVVTIKGFECLVANLLRIAVSGIGFLGFIMMIVGSFKYLLAGNNSKGVEEGKNTITMAVGGLVLALSAFIIVRLISEFTGVSNILNFTIPQ